MSAPAPAVSTKANADTQRWACSAALADLIVARVAVGGATRAELVRDLRPLTRPDLAPALWRASTDATIAELTSAGFLTDVRNRLKASASGAARAANAIGSPIAAATWAAVREGPLTALALQADPADKSLTKALAVPDQLRALIVQQAYGLGVARPMTLAKLRSALAVRALERAFGNQIKSGLGSGTGLAPRPSRLLAGQLLQRPADPGSDGRLVAALAAQHLGTANAEAETLRLAVLRRHFEAQVATEKARNTARRPAASAAAATPPETQTRARTPALVANDPGIAGHAPLPSARPNIDGFVKEVRAAAGRRAEGWPGNRKAFICHVWEEIKSAHASWALTEIEFKAMLAEAHRLGGVVLANADLKDKKYIQEFEKSAIQYKNTVWHFVRVEQT